MDINERMVNELKSLNLRMNTLSDQLRDLKSIKDYIQLSYQTLEAMHASLEPDIVKRRKRVDVVVPIEDIGFTEDIPEDWRERLRLMPRILANLDFTIQPGCWIYTGVMTQGQMIVYHPKEGRKVTLRKFLYEQMLGKLEDGVRTTQPECHERCVRPDHLKIPRLGQSHRRQIEQQDFETFMAQSVKLRQNAAESAGYIYDPLPPLHWRISYDSQVLRREVDPTIFGMYKNNNKAYHYLDPELATPRRDKGLPVNHDIQDRGERRDKQVEEPKQQLKSLQQILEESQLEEFLNGENHAQD